MFRQNRWLVLAIVSSALFLIIIDMTVLYTALPRLTHDLGATAAEKLWIVNAYPLVVAGLLPGAGLLSDRLGHKRLFLAGLPLFGLASLCAAFAPSAAALIAARAGLAVGAALMMPATLSIVRHVFQDERERALAIGIWASVASAGAALGPVVGGVLLEFFWWGSVFLINVPVVAIALLLALPAIPACGGQSRRPWDALGSLQVMFGLVGVVYAIKELSARAPDFGLAVLAALGGMLCLYLFVRRQRRAREPMIDFALFRNRRFARGVAVALVATMALVGMELVFSQHLQLVQGLTPLKAGLFVLPIPLASLVVGPLAGFQRRQALHQLQVLAEHQFHADLLLGCAGLRGLALSYQPATGAQLASLVLLGVGFGGAMTAASTAVMLNVDEQSSGMAAAIEDVSYELGGVIGVTLLGSLMSLVYGMSLRLPSAELPARVRDSLDDALLVAEGLAPEVASRLVELARQAFDQAFVAVLLAAAALLFLSAMAVLRQPRPATEPAPPAPHTR
ncbi:MFS transporter [Pseudomonas aeruginosa]|uniref:MFS transporter n=30 Tax=Pseudomonas aeruginosa TaxID=287 RepID=UPI002032D6DB|nr:MFS transporter [Pseudomonas aeruginosa]MCM2059846.1 MFS transporter [Pseudomonas aeruginosa]